MADSHNEFQRFMLKYPRPVGAVFALLAVAIFFEEVVQPIRQAEAGAPEIQIWVSGGTVGLMLAVLGLTYVIFGVRFARIFQPSAEESKAPAYIAGGLLAIVGLGIYLTLKVYLESKGYISRT
jgi:threonine/homoserine/homoserine lactone efflux protein